MFLHAAEVAWWSTMHVRMTNVHTCAYTWYGQVDGTMMNDGSIDEKQP